MKFKIKILLTKFLDNFSKIFDDLVDPVENDHHFANDLDKENYFKNKM